MNSRLAIGVLILGLGWTPAQMPEEDPPVRLAQQTFTPPPPPPPGLPSIILQTQAFTACVMSCDTAVGLCQSALQALYSIPTLYSAPSKTKQSIRGEDRRGYRWGHTQGKIGFHGGKIDIERPRVRELGGQELVLPSWEHVVAQDWLGRWAMNLMLINISTRKFRRAVRLRREV